MDALHRVASHALHGGGVLDRGGKEVAAAAASVSEEETVDERAVVLGGYYKWYAFRSFSWKRKIHERI